MMPFLVPRFVTFFRVAGFFLATAFFRVAGLCLAAAFFVLFLAAPLVFACFVGAMEDTLSSLETEAQFQIPIASLASFSDLRSTAA